MRRVRFEEEPLTIDAESVADFLRRHGQTGAASLVLSIDRSATRNNREVMRLLARITELEQKYEPRVPFCQRDYTPPPEATD